MRAWSYLSSWLSPDFPVSLFWLLYIVKYLRYYASNFSSFLLSYPSPCVLARFCYCWLVGGWVLWRCRSSSVAHFYFTSPGQGWQNQGLHVSAEPLRTTCILGFCESFSSIFQLVIKCQAFFCRNTKSRVAGTRYTAIKTKSSKRSYHHQQWFPVSQKFSTCSSTLFKQ